MSKRTLIARLKERLPGSYKRFEDIERDRRLSDADRLELLEAWPAFDDHERGRVQMHMQEIRERMKACQAGPTTQTA